MARVQRASSLLLVLVVAALALSASQVDAQLTYRFYRTSCPNVESIITSVVKQAFKKDATIAPGILRLSFHDCFVRGCDGSVLLAGPNSERAATINNRLHGFEIIDQIKAAVEKACPRTVSCADILQYAARDSVVVTGGSSWKVYAGRRDGRVSNVDEPAQNLPTGFSLAGELVSTFEQQGLSPSQMVDLSGAHTIGLTHCDHISNRIYKPVDPTMPKDLLKKFQNTCPKATTNTPIVLDQKSVSKFDTAYFKNIQKGRGVMTSDQELYNPDAYLSRYVDKNTNQDTFVHRFGAAMIAMGSIQVTVAPDGEIRKRCQYVN